MPIRTDQDLDVFRESYSLALAVSRIARAYPQLEQFELARKLRRASRSVPANIVEGWAKRSSAFEFKRYLQIAMGSCDECKFWIAMSKDEGYLSPENYQEFIDRFNPVGAMLRSLWKY